LDDDRVLKGDFRIATVEGDHDDEYGFTENTGAD
jgi:hypothetical protein